MAKLTIKRVKNGYEGREVKTYISVSWIEFEEGDEVIVIPAEFEGEPITHFGYGQDFTPAHEVWADWHHPGKGSDWEPDRHHFSYNEIRFPETVKRLVLPATVIDIAYCIPKYLKDVHVEVSPDNPRYTARDGVIYYKSSDKPLS